MGDRWGTSGASRDTGETQVEDKQANKCEIGGPEFLNGKELGNKQGGKEHRGRWKISRETREA